MKQMHRKNCLKFGLPVAMAVICGVAFGRTTYVWNADGSGGWQSKDQYFAEDGVTPAGNPPGADDVVKVSTPTTVGVDTDSDAAFVNALAAVWLAHPDSIFEFNQPSDFRWACALTGDGSAVKKTLATVELADIPAQDILALDEWTVTSYYLAGGFVIEKGRLLAPQAPAGIYSIGPVAISNEATFVTTGTKTLYVQGLFGEGLVTNLVDYAATSSGSVLNLSGRAAGKGPAEAVFDGVVAGNLRVAVTKFAQKFNGTSNTARAAGTSSGTFSYVDLSGAEVGYQSFGLNDSSPSSFGLYYLCHLYTGSHVTYLGTGERTLKTFAVDGGSAPAEFDGGSNGNIEFAGSLSQTSYPSLDAFLGMGRVVFTGANAMGPVVVSGKLSMNASRDMGGGDVRRYTCYLAKEGEGTWRFTNAANDSRGAWAIRAGTLQFDSIAEKGVPCALGTSDYLYDDIATGYCNLPDESKKVDYAFLLGGTGSCPAFEYTGDAAATCSTRPIALTGAGGRLAVSGTGSLSFSGISAHDAGEKTLTLDGTSLSSGNVISNISAGAGSVALTKDGPGKWTLRGSNDIRGPIVVKNGTLEVRDRVNEQYTWYRFVIRNAKYAGGAFYCGRLALYDDEGSNRVAGLTHRLPEGAATNTQITPVPASELKPGEATVCGGDDTTIYYYGPVTELFTYNKAFCGWGWHCIIYGISETTPGYVIFRLPEGTPDITHFDFASGDYQYITKFALHGSVDGVNWVDLTGDMTTDAANAGDYKWTSGDEYVGGNPLRPGRGYPIAARYSEPDEGGARVFDHVTSVRVDSGATLRVCGVRKSVAGLTIDCNGGFGVVKGVDFLPDGVLTLENFQPTQLNVPIAVDLSDVSDSGIANLNGYRVSVNGVVRRGYHATVTKNSVTITRDGLLLLFR